MHDAEDLRRRPRKPVLRHRRDQEWHGFRRLAPVRVQTQSTQGSTKRRSRLGEVDRRRRQVHEAAGCGGVPPLGPDRPLRVAGGGGTGPLRRAARGGLHARSVRGARARVPAHGTAATAHSRARPGTSSTARRRRSGSPPTRPRLETRTPRTSSTTPRCRAARRRPGRRTAPSRRASAARPRSTSSRRPTAAPAGRACTDRSAGEGPPVLPGHRRQQRTAPRGLAGQPKRLRRGAADDTVRRRLSHRAVLEPGSRPIRRAASGRGPAAGQGLAAVHATSSNDGASWTSAVVSTIETCRSTSSSATATPHSSGTTTTSTPRAAAS